MKTLTRSINQPESNEKNNAVMPLRLKSREIFKQQNDVVIEHEGEEYHLKLTKQNKLILTKWLDIDINIFKWNDGLLNEFGYI